MLATARIPAATGIPALSKGHKQEKAKPQRQKSQQPPNLCGKAIKVTGKEGRNIFQMKKNVDHHGPRPILNNRHFAEPPCFSLYKRTFKEVLCSTQNE
jgi:hypothetical protein